jgi:lipoprotein-anchoring transpeptidase ErfK/SrfK
MSIEHPLKTSIMLICFGSAIALFSAARQETELTSSPGDTGASQKGLASLIAEQVPCCDRLQDSLTEDEGDWHPFRRERVDSASPAVPILTQALATLGVRLVVDLSDARVYSYWGDRQMASYPVAVGQPGWETPTGEFQIANKQRNPAWKQPITGDSIPTGPDNPLGDRWIGFWSDGRHEIGFHGTNNEALIGQAVSHGCLRMRNADIRSLYEQVREGTPVIVRE